RISTIPRRTTIAPLFPYTTLFRSLRQGGNLLCLDEPTNDLDLLTLGVLEEALCAFPGCAIIVSHDRWFLDRVATGILAFEGQGRDRKSTRLNSSHVKISYAVFCLN